MNATSSRSWLLANFAPLLFAALASTAAVATTTSIVTINATRAGITIPLLVVDSSCTTADVDCEAPVATLILFTGGDGRLHLLEPTGGWVGASDLSTVRIGPTQNFLLRQRYQFAGPDPTSDPNEPTLRYHVIMMDVPSDQSGGYTVNATTGLSFRKTAKHQSDIADVIDYARTTYNLPVWLIGTSNGTTSATKGALIAAQNPDTSKVADGGPDGVVLTSPITESGNANDVTAMDLKSIGLVAMMVSSELDQCAASPPLGVYRIARHLVASPDFRGKIVTDPDTPYSTAASEVCEGDGYHGFSNSEGRAVDPIRAWIAGHL